MLYNINMEFMQAFNPLYAVPIVAVIFCALIVFTFGFKSPIQPPSFEGIEEDKKSARKRKTKEIQKQSKLVTNGKANGIAIGKGKLQEIPKKKEIVDNSVVNEKLKNEKTSADKKATKKTKSKNEKPQEKKKETVVITDELNDDGWVQLVSKKGKKNRKKEDSTGPEIQLNLDQSPIRKAAVTNDVDEVEKVSVPSHVEALNEAKKEMPEEKPLKKSSKKEAPASKKEVPVSKKEVPVSKKEAPVSKKEAPVSKKEAPIIPSPEKPVKLDIAMEVKPDENYLERDLNLSPNNIPTVSEEASKSKKKKKKQGIAPVAVEDNSIIAPPPAQIEPASPLAEAPMAPSKTSEPVVDNIPASMLEDSKTNVVFDELAGLYPEAKEKKKKKVRRDH